MGGVYEKLVILRSVNLHMIQTDMCVCVCDIITDLVLTAELEASYLRTATAEKL